MSNVTVLQTAANRFSRVAGFTPIAVDGQIGSRTIDAVQRSLDYIAVINDDSISENVSDQAAAWASASRTSSALLSNAQPIGGFLTFVADLMRLPIVASPVIPIPVATFPGGGASIPVQPFPIVAPSAGAGVLTAFKALPTWQKIILGALAGFGLLWAWGHLKKSGGGFKGLSDTLHLFTYRNKHGTFSDIWARDKDHAQEQIRRKKDRPSGFYSISRVLNVPPRRISA